MQCLQSFLSESPWDAAALNQRRLDLVLCDPATEPHAQGVLVIDETGDRKWGTKTAFQGRQYLGSRGKVESGIVSVSSVWADERLYYPLHVEPYIPAPRLPEGKADPTFRTKPQLVLMCSQTPFVLGLRAREGLWAPAEALQTAEEAAHSLGWKSEKQGSAHETE